MGAPTSVFSEIFLQFIEHTVIFDILIKQHIVGYFRYVDDILIIYDSKITDIKNVLDNFNGMHYPQKFTLEEENDN
jgi:hypothetical protein